MSDTLHTAAEARQPSRSEKRAGLRAANDLGSQRRHLAQGIYRVKRLRFENGFLSDYFLTGIGASAPMGSFRNVLTTTGAMYSTNDSDTSFVGMKTVW